MAVYFFVKGADEIEEIETLIEAVETRLYNIKKEKISDDNVYQSFLMIRNYMNLIGTMKVPLREYWLMNFETRDKEVELAKKLVGFSQIDDTNHLEYGIYLAGKLIGFINDCGFENNEIEIGYVVHPDYQGQGYATESVKAVIEDIRDMGFKKVIAGFFEENVASCRVMEKCGMKLNNETDEEEYRGVVHKCLYCELEL